jgi:threonine dehydrogenase-like Zn-dependent dehydrogenase
MAAENANIARGDTVLVLGCGPVGQFSIRSAFLLGAGRVIAVDTVPERLAMARAGGAETLDYRSDRLLDEIKDKTGRQGPDSVIEAVGLESHGVGSVMETLQTRLTEQERPYAFETAIMACRPGGTVSLPGVFIDKVTVPMGTVVGKALTLKTGQTHVQKYLAPLMQKIVDGEVDPSFLITHRIGLEQGPELYKTFRDKEDGCIKVFIRP